MSKIFEIISLKIKLIRVSLLNWKTRSLKRKVIKTTLESELLMKKGKDLERSYREGRKKLKVLTGKIIEKDKEVTVQEENFLNKEVSYLEFIRRNHEKATSTLLGILKISTPFLFGSFAVREDSEIIRIIGLSLDFKILRISFIFLTMFCIIGILLLLDASEKVGNRYYENISILYLVDLRELRKLSLEAKKVSDDLQVEIQQIEKKAASLKDKREAYKTEANKLDSEIKKLLD